MYMVTNLTTKTIHISDLNLMIEPKQALNLDKMNLKISPNQSRDLESAKRSGFVRVLKKEKKPEPQVVVNEKHEHNNVYNTNNNIDMPQLLSAMQDMIQSELSKKQGQIPVAAPDNSEMLDAINKLKSEISKKKDPIIVYQRDESADKDKQSEIDEFAIDDETRSRIHAKTMNKMAEGVDGVIEMEEKDVIDSSLGDNISELGDLL